MHTPTNPLEMETHDFITRLSEQLPAKRKYYPPVIYLGFWLVGSLAYILLIANTMLDLRFDLAMRLSDPKFFVTVVFMFLSTLAFGYSTVTNSLPGKRDSFGWVALATTLVWAGIITYDMLDELPVLFDSRVLLYFNWQIFFVFIAGGSLPLFVFWLTVKHLAPLRAYKVAISMSIASFTLSATVLRFYSVFLYNGYDSGFNIFIWVLLPLMFASLCGCVAVAPFMRFWLPRLRLH